MYNKKLKRKKKKKDNLECRKRIQFCNSQGAASTPLEWVRLHNKCFIYSKKKKKGWPWMFKKEQKNGTNSIVRRWR